MYNLDSINDINNISSKDVLRNYIDEYCYKIAKYDDSMLVIDGNSITTRKEDGYVKVTEIFKLSGKNFGNWIKADKTKEFLTSLEDDLSTRIDDLIKYEKKTNLRSTWTHPLIAIHIAQWCSVDFGIKVTKWIFKLLTYGSVSTTDSTDSIEDDMNSWKQKIAEVEDSLYRSMEREKLLVKNLDSTKQMLDAARLLADRLSQDNLSKSVDYDEMVKKCQQLQKKVSVNEKKHLYHKFKSGPCYYILSGTDCTRRDDVVCFKHGITGTGVKSDINSRLRNYRTTTSGMKIEYLVYFEDVKLLENQMKAIYKKDLKYQNHEWFTSTDPLFLDNFIQKAREYLSTYFKDKFTEETRDNLDAYNTDQRSVDRTNIDDKILDEDDGVVDNNDNNDNNDNKNKITNSNKLNSISSTIKVIDRVDNKTNRDKTVVNKTKIVDNKNSKNSKNKVVIKNSTKTTTKKVTKNIKVGKYLLSELKTMDLYQLLNTELEALLVELNLAKSGVKAKKIERILNYIQKYEKEHKIVL